MPCNCDDYIDCGDSIKVDSSAGNSSSGSISHRVNHKVECTNLPITFLDNTVRSFDMSWSRSSSGGDIGYVVSCDGISLSCGSSSGSESTSASVSENCKREKNIPYYLDRFNNIFVYRSVVEELKFDVSSNKMAAFRVKWPPASYHKLCVPSFVQTKGTEKFIMVKDGIETILATVEYAYNPFPFADVGGGMWGLYGNVVDYGTETPETPDVAIILLTPLVPKLAQPEDRDVKYYGFYDYNAIAGGFVENELPKDDGGKDYFYPYWCRQMLQDKLWREVADMRYESIYAKTDFNGTTTWSDVSPEVYSLPFGAFAVDSKEAFIYSMLGQFSDRAGGSGVVVNYSSFGDLYKAIYIDNKIVAGNQQVFFPVSPL